MATNYLFLLSFTLLLFSSCKKDDNPIVENSNATPVYNQAYIENFEEDKIEDIISQAHNAYVLIDPFLDNVASSVAEIKSKGNQVGAYISIGTGENWRTDYSQMVPFLVTSSWGQWPDEYFVNSTTTGILDIMKSRIDQIASWGCDWVEFDNMDWVFDDDLRALYNFEVTIEEGMAYYNELCDYVHEKGMKCMSKNLATDVDKFDGVLFESYDIEKNWWSETGLKNFVNSGKLSIIVHYNEPDCNKIYNEYKSIYGADLSFICEDSNIQKYVHFNQ